MVIHIIEDPHQEVGFISNQFLDFQRSQQVNSQMEDGRDAGSNSGTLEFNPVFDGDDPQ